MSLRDRYALVTAAISALFGAAAGLETHFFLGWHVNESWCSGVVVFCLFLYFFRPERWA